MKFTLNWLKQYIDFDMSPVALTDRLTMLGLEVDAVEDLYPDLDQVKVAKIDAVQSHPNADKLVLCDVSVGEKVCRVVCGAPNAREGMLTAIALPGAVLPGGFTVKPTKIRGEASEGMLCSEKELGISDDQAGIMELPPDMESGRSLSDALGFNDTFVEVDLTPNRPDCASVIGIAREVAGVVGNPLNPPVDKNTLPNLTGEGIPFSVKVEAPDGCPRYTARMLTNVTIGPSPWWLKQKLLAVGMRPINNVVDVTNFVMMEYGQPLHAFDYKKIAGGQIIVRKARADEKITTLDGVERRLDSEMLLICDTERPVAIAGVMGGENSEVIESTTEVLLESAYFDAINVRRTASKLNLSTESSYRFERGVDPQGVPSALERAAQLIKELAGAELIEGGVDCCEDVKTSLPITLRIQRVSDQLGMDFSGEDIIRSLSSIEIDVERIDDQVLTVYPPSFRVDLEREADLVEELARLKGYDEIPTSLPLVPMSFPERDAARDLSKQISNLMISLGFNEAINYSFVTVKHFDMLGLADDDPSRSTLRLLNPLTEDQSVMRTTLLPGLLENLRRNINHQNYDVRLFEIGKVFYYKKDKELPDEQQRLTALLCGRQHPYSPRLYNGETMVDILDVKGVVETMLDDLRFPQVAILRDQSPVSYVEAESFVKLEADNQLIGNFGRIKTSVLKAFGIKQDVFFLDINLDALYHLPQSSRSFKQLPKFPSVQWDIAVLVPDQVAGGELLSAIAESDEPIVESAEIFDVYRGKNIAKGYKSVAISVTYRSNSQTLNDETVDTVHQKIIDMILTRFNGQLREA